MNGKVPPYKLFPWLQKNGVTLDYTIYGVIYNPIGNMKQLLVVKFIVSVYGVMRMMHGCHITRQLHFTMAGQYPGIIKLILPIICILFCIPSF